MPYEQTWTGPPLEVDAASLVAWDRLAGCSVEAPMEWRLMVGKLIGEVRRLRADPTMRMFQDLRALYPGSRLHIFAEDAPGDLPRLRAAERLADAHLAWNRREDIDDDGMSLAEATAAELEAYRKAKLG